MSAKEAPITQQRQSRSLAMANFGTRDGYLGMLYQISVSIAKVEGHR